MTGQATILQGDARQLPLADNSVDLICTSPPFFALRSYRDNGQHYAGQIGDEPTPAEFVDALIDVTRECMRVLKPSGSCWINLGDKYASGGSGPQGATGQRIGRSSADEPYEAARRARHHGTRDKSLLGLPWRYALRCIDELGLILRAEVVWAKPNGLPESVTDRVRRSHEQWFHMVQQPRYYSAVDEIRESYDPKTAQRYAAGYNGPGRPSGNFNNGPLRSIADGDDRGPTAPNPLGKLPGSVWTIPTEPLIIPDHISHAVCCRGRRRAGCKDGLDHFAAFATELPRRIILGWSPSGICMACGDGRRPINVTDREHVNYGLSKRRARERIDASGGAISGGTKRSTLGHQTTSTITGYACACTPYTDHPGTGESSGLRYAEAIASGMAPAAIGQNWGGNQSLAARPKTGPWREYHFDRWTPAPTTPATILDPFGGTGTTAMVAKVLGRHGISVDMSHDYCRLAQWRTTDPDQLAKAARVEKPPKQVDGQESLLDMLGEAT